MPSSLDTVCIKIGCVNYNHCGFQPENEETREVWRQWLLQGGLGEEEFILEQELRVCYRHFDHKQLTVINNEVNLLHPDTAVPKLYPCDWDKRKPEDQILHYEACTALTTDVYRANLKRTKRKLANERNNISLSSKTASEETITAAKKPKKVPKPEEAKPEKIINYDILFSTAATLSQNILGAHRLIPFAPVSHAPDGSGDNESYHAMSEVREALLRHDWDLALKLLPMLFMKRHCLQFIWRSYLQIFCHHPNSTPELLRELLETCFGKISIPTTDLEKVFCLPKPSEENLSKKDPEEMFKMCSIVYQKASVIHKLQQDIPSETIRKFTKNVNVQKINSGDTKKKAKSGKTKSNK
ncbi:uncharacterized protein LOC132195623 [Neocloeon triangulifer]|uniref:uncharacterized protein LOC132195623 n=1 Tax=Neocloeon triangulifer TaxID=2078957 RepID=UPI00286F1CFC|nr:uncharacterized protein LOC132195623 [Neocloeon triangulifer]